MFTLNCKGKLLSLQQPAVMGIINITPDSFYTGYWDETLKQVPELALQMIRDGAAILDVGGQSTRPGSERIGAGEEADRVLPVIAAIREVSKEIVISIDTYHSKVAAAAVHAGASIINDVSGGELDPGMIETAAKLQVPYICMHMKGTPETMQASAIYEDVTKELLDHFSQKVKACTDAGITDLVIDPGFGFGKNIGHNLKLLSELHLFSILGKPILAGLSRKSTVYKTLGIGPGESLNGSTVLHTIALQQGANILRVHDVKEAVEAVKLVEAFKKASA